MTSVTGAPRAKACLVRTAREDDLGDLLALAGSLEGGLTTLPDDAANLESRIETSLRSLDPRVRAPGPEYYLFVLEDTAAGRVLGTCSLIARVGGFDPSYTYAVRREPFVHAPLGIEKELDVLHLAREHKGPSEIGGLALRPEARARGLGRLLSLSRFLFVHAHPHRFAERIMAELRGWLDDEGRSPFWEHVGRHFFGHDLAEADRLTGLGYKDFIEDLVPRHPIYVALLPEPAREAVGRVHRDALPALRLLEEEGFGPAGEVDIFDAGPVVAAETAAIRTFHDARRAAVAAVDPGAPDGEPHLLAAGGLDFRACLGAAAERSGGGVELSVASARLLGVSEGDEVTICPTRGARPAAVAPAVPAEAG